MKSLKPFIVAVLLYALPAFPWGRVGHETIAYIAQKNLSPATADKIKPLLAGESIEEVSIWADIYKKNHRNTAPWHYINLPVRDNVTASDVPKYYAPGKRSDDNLVSQINEEISFLKSGKGSFAEKQKSLWFLIHFIGDVHMPLHVGDDSDKGGNDKPVRYFSPTSRSNKGHVTNLHSLWDNLVEVKAAEDPAELGKRLNKKISSDEKQRWDSGSIEDWAVESYSVARNVIYQGMPKGPTETVTRLLRDYHLKVRPICDEQLEKGGVRLAYILEDIFGK